MQKYFNAIADNRHQSFVKHRLQDILAMIMCAVLRGLDELGAVMVYILFCTKFWNTGASIKTDGQ